MENMELAPKHGLDEIKGIKHRLRINLATVRDMAFLCTYATKYFRLKTVARQMYETYELEMSLKEFEIMELVRQLNEEKAKHA